MGLVTLDDTKDYLGIPLPTTTFDVFLNSQIAFLSSTIESYCRRKFEQATYTQEFYYDQYPDPVSRQHLWSFYYPLISIASIKEITTVNGVDSETLIDAQEYRSLNTKGKIERYNCFGVRELWFNNMSEGYQARTQIVYDAGYATIPLEIQHVMYELIEERYNKKVAGVALNFGSDVQRLSVPGVMSIDFDYTLQNNERDSKFGMFIKGYANVLDSFRSERSILADSIKDGYVS